MNNTKRIALFLALAAIVLVIVFIEGGKKPIPKSNVELPIMSVAEKEKLYPHAQELTGIAGYINTKPIKIADLIGKQVILVDFWTYSCINCQRTLPYLNAWQKQYGDKGLTIIGVHTPEFDFEKDQKNVEAAAQKYGIKYPVVLDNDYGTWTAYGNRYWPREYLIDIDGYVVHDHIGEGSYDETESLIRKLLTERAQKLGENATLPAATTVQTETIEAGSPEIYFGALRNTYLGNGKDGVEGLQTFTEPTGIKTNILYLSGIWNFNPEFAENKGAGKIVFRYQAKNVYIVAGSDTGITATVLRDGKPITADVAGEDVHNGTVTIKDERLYKLIEDKIAGEHTLEIVVPKAGLKAFTFTFG